jgi:hypothetical protein
MYKKILKEIRNKSLNFCACRNGPAQAVFIIFSGCKYFIFPLGEIYVAFVRLFWGRTFGTFG